MLFNPNIINCSENVTVSVQCKCSVYLPVHAGIASRLPFTLNRNKQVKRMNERKSFLYKQAQMHEFNVNWHTFDYNKRLSHLKAQPVWSEFCVVRQGYLKFIRNILVKSEQKICCTQLCLVSNFLNFQ